MSRRFFDNHRPFTVAQARGAGTRACRVDGIYRAHTGQTVPGTSWTHFGHAATYALEGKGTKGRREGGRGKGGKGDSLTRPLGVFMEGKGGKGDRKGDSLTRPLGVFMRFMPSRKHRIPPDALNLNELQVYWPAARRRNATNRTVRCERLWTMSHGCLILELHARQGLAGRRAWNPIDGIRFQRRQNAVGTGQAVPFHFHPFTFRCAGPSAQELKRFCQKCPHRDRRPFRYCAYRPCTRCSTDANWAPSWGTRTRWMWLLIKQ